MIPVPQPPPSVEDLHEFFLLLKAKVESMEGAMRQILAERTRDALPHPTWRDIEALKKDIARLEQMLSTHSRVLRIPGADDKVV